MKSKHFTKKIPYLVKDMELRPLG